MTQERLKQYPKKIYLQIEDYEGNITKPEGLHEHEVTWCEDRVNKSDIVYYRHKGVK